VVRPGSRSFHSGDFLAETLCSEKVGFFS